MWSCWLHTLVVLMNGIHMMCPWISSETHIIPEFMKTVSLMRYWLFSNIFLITEFLLSFNVNSAARVGHYGTFYKLKWRFWHFSLLAHSHNCSDCFIMIFVFQFLFSQCSSKVKIPVRLKVQLIFLGRNMVWALVRASQFTLALQLRLKSLWCTPTNINSVFILFVKWPSDIIICDIF